AYEIVTYSLFETVITCLEAEVSVCVPQKNRELLKEFADLGRVLLGLHEDETEWTQLAHVYRVGVTNAADRGLDMWTNFGPAVQVKHLTLDQSLAKTIVNQVESDCMVIVCRDADAQVLEMVTQQISWGSRVRAVVKESQLVQWYEQCLRGKFANQLADRLLQELSASLHREFPQVSELANFFQERGYNISL
ncbi:MAG: HaeII family restriction endonuclease, partial [Kamptonema sp. SIO4C4]|nr:HaeII family restriction endonuclease [Kamptonema sp. SIO4C4]